MSIFTGNQLTSREAREASTEQLHVVGTEASTADGRKFRYMRVGAVALVKGNLLQGPANAADHANQVVGDNAAVGDLSVNVDIGNTALTENQYAGGFMVINDAAGEGITYGVSGHAAADASATSVVINLTEPVDEAMTADTSQYTLHSLWNDVIQSPTTATNVSVGVADVAYAIDNYFWGQTKGVASVLQEMSGGASAIGDGLVPSNGTAGAVEITAQGVNTQEEIGRALIVGVDGEHNGVYLTID